MPGGEWLPLLGSGVHPQTLAMIGRHTLERLHRLFRSRLDKLQPRTTRTCLGSAAVSRQLSSSPELLGVDLPLMNQLEGVDLKTNSITVSGVDLVDGTPVSHEAAPPRGIP